MPDLPLTRFGSFRVKQNLERSLHKNVVHAAHLFLLAMATRSHNESGTFLVHFFPEDAKEVANALEMEPHLAGHLFHLLRDAGFVRDVDFGLYEIRDDPRKTDIMINVPMSPRTQRLARKGLKKQDVKENRSSRTGADLYRARR
jgi:hypothetical protein